MEKINLLSQGNTNTKTAKNSLKTFILYLSPYNLNSKGVNICPKASKGCAAACLFSAGRGAFSNVQKARQNKTEYYLKDKQGFVLNLSNQIMKEYTKAKKGNYKIAFRLNGTSDIDFVYLLNKYANLDISTLKDFAVFYDYTKILGKAKKYINHPNYTVTFSRAEDNNEDANEAIKLGVNVAAVFSGDLPQRYKGAKVLDGDASDLVMIYNKGIVLGLKAKGKAKKDNSGFVINTNLPF